MAGFRRGESRSVTARARTQSLLPLWLLCHFSVGAVVVVVVVVAAAGCDVVCCCSSWKI